MRSTSAPNTAQQAERFHALADETRLAILELLREGERCVCELTEALELGQSLLSFHVKTLKAAGLITDRREGRWMYYAIDPGVLAEMAGYLASVAPRPKRSTRKGRCCD